ncbi:tyrosine-type recombinase/integrase [Streptomyces sp. NPDC007164]|uniref:tyrosine-type recombinase/integrase n=1 Tax=Streptomyces sp. NPDC007164 TaxID=3156918 RepID=UPI0034112E56
MARHPGAGLTLSSSSVDFLSETRTVDCRTSISCAGRGAALSSGSNLPEYNPHNLRHKWTTVTMTNGVSIHEVSRWLGHRSIKVTVDRYGHLAQDGQERCRQVVETAVGPYLLTAGPASAARGAGCQST